MTSRRNSPPGLRSRTRADGSLRVWWEPTPAARALGFEPVDLDPQRLTWSHREAARLNREVAAAVHSSLPTGRATGYPFSTRRVSSPKADYKRNLGHRQRARHASWRSIEALAEDYMRSSRFTRRAPATKADYRRNIARIVAKWGDEPVADFSKPVLYRWYETLREEHGDHMALALQRMASILFAHAELIGWRPEGTNPAARLRAHVPPPRARVLTWTEIDALVAAADAIGQASMGTAILLSLLQGQRQTDVFKARAADFQEIEPLDEPAPVLAWSFTRSKRQNAALLRLHPDVEPRVRAALPAEGEAREALLIDEITGKPYRRDAIQKRFAAVRAEAAKAVPSVATVQFRDLRRTWGNLTRAAGTSKDDAADVLGNSANTNPRLGETYLGPSFTTTSRAVLAIRRPAPPDTRKKA